jgi:hypothetical protein
VTTWEYVYLAAGTFVGGTMATFALVPACNYLNVNMADHVWLLAIPVVLSLVVNVSAIELYRRRNPK